MIHVVLLLWLPIVAATQDHSLSAAQQHAVDRYVRDTAALQSGTSDVSIEQVFGDALRIRELLGGFTATEPSIEQLPERDFVALQRRLPGIVVNREEVILAEPDSQYFHQLARKHGTAIDVQFFELFRTTFPTVWPVYVAQQTDFSGCVDFGKGHLVRAYQSWTEFKRMHPARYRAEVDRVIRDVEQHALGTCACGDRASVLRELQDFATRFPRSPVQSPVMQRIRELNGGTGAVRFRCVSG